MIEDQVAAQLPFALWETDLTGLGERVRGKVRDIYRKDDQLILVTSDRVSAFDHVLGTIPFKGQILNALALAGFSSTQDLAPNHLIAAPDPNVLVVKRCRPYPVEFVVRGYLTGSLWRDVLAGTAGAYGVQVPSGMAKDAPFETPILTPTTKAEAGSHDTPISRAEILQRGLMTADAFDAAEKLVFQLYQRGCAQAAQRGLILVDTKYELGEDAAGQLTVIDELHTPDSSRYWVAECYEDRFEKRQPQQMLDKENLRAWLIDTHGFSGHGTPPKLDDLIRVQLALKYLELHETLLGKSLELQIGDVAGRIERNLRAQGYLR